MAVAVSPDYDKTLYFSDGHNPYLDPRCWSIMLQFIGWWKPKTIYNIGDWMDFPQISKFDKDPNRLLRIQDDLDFAIARQGELRTAAGDQCEIVFVEGNHDDRWRKHLWRNPETANLRSNDIRRQLELEKTNIRWVFTLQDEVHNGFLVEHGEKCSKHSAYTAKAQMEGRGTSGISGHTHRLGSFYRTDYGGDAVWRECGCLCSRVPHYTKRPNWQNGFTIGYHKASGRFELHEIPIVTGKAIYAGIEFTPDPAQLWTTPEAA